jgi:hypothetical protein
MMSCNKVQAQKWLIIWRWASHIHDKHISESYTGLFPISEQWKSYPEKWSYPLFQMWVCRPRWEPSALLLTSGWHSTQPSSSSAAGPPSRSGAPGSSECFLRCSEMAGHPWGSGPGCSRAQTSGRHSAEQGRGHVRTSASFISDQMLWCGRRPPAYQTCTMCNAWFWAIPWTSAKPGLLCLHSGNSHQGGSVYWSPQASATRGQH